MQRQLTSVFSDYQTIDNGSANSKQLQYWLKQISSLAPSQNAGFQWTLMSNRSSQFDRNTNKLSSPNSQVVNDVSFGKTLQSIQQKQNKQNNSLLSNNTSTFTLQNKSKSYVNAMMALQKKVKSLEDQNMFIRRNIARINEDRTHQMTQSHANESQLKAKIEILEPRLARMDNLIQENKVLRETKQEKNRRLKQMQKINIQLNKKLKQFEQKCDNQTKQNSKLKLQLQKLKTHSGSLQTQIKKLYEKNKILEDMKEKSTVSLMQKYNKSIQLIENLEKQNVKLKNQSNHDKKIHINQLKQIQQKYYNQIKQLQIQHAKLKQALAMKDNLISEKKKENMQLKQQHQKLNSQFINIIRSRQQNQNAQVLRNIQNILKQRQVQTNLRVKNVQKPSNRSSRIQIPQTLVIQQTSPKQNQSFNGFSSEDENQYFDESVIPQLNQTKSVDKSKKTKLKTREKQHRNILSSQQRNQKSVNEKISPKISKPAKNPVNQHSKMLKTNRRSGEKQNESFTIKSCEGPKSRSIHKITFQGNLNSEPRNQKQKKIKRKHNIQENHANYEQQNTVKQNQNIIRYQSSSWCNVDEALLIQLQKQLLQLYDEQQKLILYSNDENADQNDRSQFVGRLKQINQQLRIKNQRICQLKSKV